MRCLYCNNRIGILRRLRDGEYCSSDHKRIMRAQSARAVRNARDEHFDEVWPIYLRPLDSEHEQRPPSQSNLVSTGVFILLILGALVVGSVGLSSPDTAVKLRASAPFEDLRKAIKSHAAVSLRDNFETGLKNWVPTAEPTTAPAKQAAAAIASAGDNWTFNHGFVQPGRLRLWKESMNLTDYQLEFVSQIERKGLGWVYRAADHDNYYATKIRITKPGPLPQADLLRYAVIGGKDNSRVTLPLPLVLRNDTLYRVQVAVRGDQFSTSVNGQMVDTWTDARLKAGGVGFFTEKGENATLRWVTVTDRDNFLGHVLSYFGFFTPIRPEVYVAILPEL